MNMEKRITRRIAVISMALLMAWIVAGCKKHGADKVPILTLIEDSIVAIHNKAWVVAEVTDGGGGTITERGFCYGIVGGPVDTLFCDGTDRFSAELVDLKPSKPYVCKAFAVNETGWGLSTEFRFATLSDTIPLVSTLRVSEITPYSAVVSGRIISGGYQTVLGRGVCFGTEYMPTVDDTKVPAGTGLGSYECQLMLVPETFYYVRAYAECSEGVYYGEQLTFTAKPDIPPLAVRTLGVSDVTGRRVKGRGVMVSDGGLEVIERGFCWGQEHQPTIDGFHIKAGTGMGEFSYHFSGLERGRTYYMRAYAINEEAVAYGEEVEFVPDDATTPWPDGTLPGLFSVSADRQVRFSQGNLQYYADDNIWRFAESQWDYVGGSYDDFEWGRLDFGTVYANGTKCDNALIGRYYAGWIDLFGWGTSGWDNGNQYYHPWDDKANTVFNPYFGPWGNHDLTGEYSHADWGVHVNIPTGGSRLWRTLTKEEFVYLLEERITASNIRYALASVAGVCGMLLLPDDWDASSYAIYNPNEGFLYVSNIISATDWINVMEPAGAVFLPAAGERCSSYSYELGVYLNYYANDPGYPMVNIESSGYGQYWTSSQGLGVNVASCIYISNYFYNLNEETGRSGGCSVRLITDE